MDSRSRDSKRRRLETSSRRSRERTTTTYRSPERHSNYTEFESSYKKDNSLSSFYPDEPEQPIEKWLRKVEDARKVNNWSESTTIYYALNKLKGSAEIWYKSLPELKLNWEEWKEKLVHAFPSNKDYYQLLEDMVKRKKLSDETYSKYFFDKLALVNLCKISGRDAVSCIIGGLSEEIKPSARIGNFKEPEDIYEYLLGLNRGVSNVKGSYTPDKVHLTENRDKNSRNTYNKKESRDSYRAKSSDDFKDIEHRSSYRVKESRGDYRDKDIKDPYREKVVKESIRDLYSEKEPRINYREKDLRDNYLEKDLRGSYSVREKDLRLTLTDNSLKCYSCGGPGHFAKDCPKLKDLRFCKFCYRTGHTEDRCYDRNMVL